VRDVPGLFWCTAGERIMAQRAGLVIVNTGDGKGKTTAALGAAMRAAGHERKVLVMQFIKGPWKSGEHEAAHRLEPLVEMRTVGKGFVRPDGRPEEEDVDAAHEGLKEAREALESGEYGLVVLDEVLYAIDYGLLSVEDVLEAVGTRGAGVDVILTGRNAPPAIVELADTVTEFREVKHPFRSGIKARKGIEY
jgi:cob(I)alamin adenosyltransferase